MDLAKNEWQRICSIAHSFRLRVVAGELSFGQTARLIRGVSAYVGVDIATTHVATAIGTPVIAQCGPTNVEIWAPLPAGKSRERFTEDVAVCTVGNVTVICNANYLHCHTSTRHRCPFHSSEIYAQCLQTLDVDVVWGSLIRVLVNHQALSETEKTQSRKE